MNLVVDNIPYVSVWDSGIEVKTTCTVNLETGEVTEISAADVRGLDVCEEQYVVLNDEVVYIYENERGFPYWADIHGELACPEKDQSAATAKAAIRKCRCGGTEFYAHQMTRHDILVDPTGIFLEDRGIYDAEYPYGPFTCTLCGTEYDELEDLDPQVPVVEQNQSVFSIIEPVLELAGYKVLDGDRDSVFIRHVVSGTDIEIKVTEI